MSPFWKKQDDKDEENPESYITNFYDENVESSSQKNITFSKKEHDDMSKEEHKTVSEISPIEDSKDVKESLISGTQNTFSNDDLILCFLTTMLKYGCLTVRHVEKIFAKETSLPAVLKESLDIIPREGKECYFLTEKSLQLYMQTTGIARKELGKKIPFYEQFAKNNLSQILYEIDILLAFENAFRQGEKYLLFDWLSSHNPRKKKMLKIRKCKSKRGSLSPSPVIVLKKNEQKCCLIFDTLSCHPALVPGEKLLKFITLIENYHFWLSQLEKIATWIKKRKLYVSVDSIAVMLLLPKEHGNILPDLIQICSDREIESQIHLAKYEDFLQAPLSCWHTCARANKKIFVKSKCRKKSQKNFF